MGSATSSVKTSILSDPGLVIDTENYDPTEPTSDDDSADEESSQVSAPSPQVISHAPSTCACATAPAAPVSALPPEQYAVKNILAGLDSTHYERHLTGST